MVVSVSLSLFGSVGISTFCGLLVTTGCQCLGCTVILLEAAILSCDGPARLAQIAHFGLAGGDGKSRLAYGSP